MRADRLITILLLLQSRGRMSAPDLAEELEVSTRTVLRDIEALGSAGVPVYSIRGPAGGFEIWQGFRSQLTGLSGDEAEALFLMGLPGPARLLGLGDALDRSALKLRESLSPGMRARAEAGTQRFFFDPDPWDGEAPVAAIEFLAVAIRRRREVEATWHQQRVTLRPLSLVCKESEWYVVADMDERAVVRVADVRDLATTGARFEHDPSFDLRAFWSSWVNGGHPPRAAGG